MQYRTFRTQAGFSLEAAMVAKGEKLVLSHMALGDGGGASYEPDSNQTSLKNEITRFKLNDLSQKKDDPTSWFAEGICPEDQGGFTIREAGLFTEDGTLYAIASLPEQYRPSASDGVIGQFVLRMNFKSANTQNITLNLDKNIITATKKWVNDTLEKYATKDFSKGILSFNNERYSFGYQILASGLIFQWGHTNLPGDGKPVTQTLPVTFPNKFFGAVSNDSFYISSGENSGALVTSIIMKSNSEIKVFSREMDKKNVSCGVTWLVWGI